MKESSTLYLFTSYSHSPKTASSSARSSTHEEREEESDPKGNEKQQREFKRIDQTLALPKRKK